MFTPPPLIKKRKITAKLVNMPSSTSSSNVDLVNFSSSLHAKSPVSLAADVNLAEFSTDLHVLSKMPSSAVVYG